MRHSSGIFKMILSVVSMVVVTLGGFELTAIAALRPTSSSSRSADSAAKAQEVMPLSEVATASLQLAAPAAEAAKAVLDVAGAYFDGITHFIPSQTPTPN